MVNSYFSDYFSQFGTFFTYLFEFMFNTSLVGNITIGLFFEGVLIITIVLTFIHAALLNYRNKGGGNDVK